MPSGVEHARGVTGRWDRGETPGATGAGNLGGWIVAPALPVRQTAVQATHGGQASCASRRREAAARERRGVRADVLARGVSRVGVAGLQPGGVVSEVRPVGTQRQRAGSARVERLEVLLD